MKNNFFVIFVITLFIFSCRKDKVEPVTLNDPNPIIPPPVPLIDLNCHFTGVISGSNVELTENVLGYYGESSDSNIILPAPSFSSRTYFFKMSSQASPISIKLGIGSIYWDESSSSDPNLISFNDFFQNNLNPAYSNFGLNGAEISYTDVSGVIWKSHENSLNSQSISFSDILQESDTSGDYSKFSCSFECYVYSQDNVSLLWDSLLIQNALFTGYFKR